MTSALRSTLACTSLFLAAFAASDVAAVTPQNPSAVAATASATTGAALTWSDLVRRPETRPTACTILKEFKFQGGQTIRAGTTVLVFEAQPNELVVGTPDGATNFGVKPQETDIVELANKQWAGLSPAQRALTYDALLRRPELWPYRIKLALPFTLEGRKTKVGDPAIFMTVENGQLLIRLEATEIIFNVAPQETNLLTAARAALATDGGAPGRVLEEFSGKTVSPLTGAPLAVSPATTKAKYVVMYMGAGWCGPCQQFSPGLVKALKDKGPKSADFLPLYLSGDRSAAEAKAYATKIGIDWPTIYFKNRGQLPAFGPLFGNVIPQLVVTDRHGKVVIDSSKTGYDRALQQLQQL